MSVCQSVCQIMRYLRFEVEWLECTGFSVNFVCLFGKTFAVEVIYNGMNERMSVNLFLKHCR